jgi:DNA repair ATPase RecN
MRGELRRTSFAILSDLESVRSRFRPGVDVPTGETGAGKSLIDEAVNSASRA